MPTTLLVQQGDSSEPGAANKAMHIVADGLADRGLNVSGPAWEESHLLKFTNVRGAVCEMTLRDDGSVEWEYLLCHGAQAESPVLVDMVMEILNGRPEYRGLPVPRYPNVTTKGVAGRALRERGMEVHLTVLSQDDDFYELYAGIEITNPSRPERGTVRIGDDNSLHWECSFTEAKEGAAGIDPAEITETIARVLSGAAVSLEAR